MSTNHKTKSAKSGETPKDRFDPGKSHITLAGVGRMQQRGIVTVLFDPTNDLKTVPFVTLSRDRSGVRFIAGGVRFDGKGNVMPDRVPDPAPVAIARKSIDQGLHPDPTKVVSEVKPEVKPESIPEVKPESEPEVTQASLGL